MNFITERVKPGFTRKCDVRLLIYAVPNAREAIPVSLAYLKGLLNVILLLLAMDALSQSG